MNRFMLALLIIMMSISLAGSTQAQNPTISVGASVTGSVSATQTQEWQFTPTQNQSLNVIVQRIADDLDPTIAIYDPNGAIIAQNDDHITGKVFDAAVQAVPFQQNITYGIRVGSYAGSGDYRLWLVPGYAHVWESESFVGNASRWVGPYAKQQQDTLLLSTEGLVGRRLTSIPAGQVAIDDFYLQADFQWVSGDNNASVGLFFWATTNGDGYYFAVSPNGTWSLLRQQGGVQETVQPPTADTQLPAERFALGVWAEGNILKLFLNGALLAEIPVSDALTGLWGFHIYGSQLAALAQVDNILLTVPEASPEPAYPSTLTNWRSGRPEDITAEFSELGMITTEGRRTLFINETGYQINPQQNRFYTQSNEAGYNYVVGVDVTFPAGGDIGCGVALRHTNDANQLIAYADTAGGAALVRVRDGILQFNAYDTVPTPLEPVSDGATRLIAILDGEWAALYVNGEFFASTFAPPTIGEIGATLLNYAAGVGSCSYSNLWVWAFDSP
ncbi:MAG: hypothetical protein H6673_04505 [Anaerolineales bacterium]|nr:hypothetical protein [Anaerolineales bacterium]